MAILSQVTPFKGAGIVGISLVSGIAVIHTSYKPTIAPLSQRLHITTMWLTNTSPIVVITGE